MIINADLNKVREFDMTLISHNETTKMFVNECKRGESLGYC